MTFCNLLEFYTIGLIDDIPLIDGTRYVKVLYPLAFSQKQTNKELVRELICTLFIVFCPIFKLFFEDDSFFKFGEFF
jgi:hypothetical protein